MDYRKILDALVESNMFYLACAELISADTNIDKKSIEEHMETARGLLSVANDTDGVTEEMTNYLKEAVALLTKELESFSDE